MGIFQSRKKKKGKTEFVKDPAAFIRFLREEDEELAEFGQTSLVAAGAEVIDPLIEILTSENEDEKTRRRAGIVIGKIGDPAITPLLKVLEGQDFKTAFSAGVVGMTADALSRIGNQAIESLIQSLNSESRGLKFGAAIALVRIGDPKGIEEVQNAASIANPGDRSMFEMALGQK